MFLYKRFRFLCFFIFLLSFANCLTFHLREKQNRIPFYKYERPVLNGILILQSKGHPILELSYAIKNKKNQLLLCNSLGTKGPKGYIYLRCPISQIRRYL